MLEKDKQLLRQFCKYWRKEFKCECWACPLYGLLWCAGKVYDEAWTMQKAVRQFVQMSVPRDKAREIIEEVIGAPLDIVQITLREIEDYEQNKSLL